MSTFLNRILDQKQREVEALYAKNYREQFTRQVEQTKNRKTNLFATAISDPSRLSIIAEIKRASPSKGVINEHFDILERAAAYEAGGAAAISVLTDSAYFHGSITDLKNVRQKVKIPILRKDFIIDPIQVDESLAAGAHAILLIAAAMSSEKLKELSTYAKEIGLDVLIEVHSPDEVETALNAKPSVLGINNRDLHTFEVSLETTVNITRTLPRMCPVISESGFLTTEDVKKIVVHNIDGILVGESLMRETSHSRIQSTILEFSSCVFSPAKGGCKA